MGNHRRRGRRPRGKQYRLGAVRGRAGGGSGQAVRRAEISVETWGFVEALSSFLAGGIAMTISSPPFGRWAAGYGTEEEALSWVPKSTIADKVGYALPPGGTPQLAAGFSLSVASGSKNKEAAYLFIQWLNSEETSLQRVQLPYRLSSGAVGVVECSAIQRTQLA